MPTGRVTRFAPCSLRCASRHSHNRPLPCSVLGHTAKLYRLQRSKHRDPTARRRVSSLGRAMPVLQRDCDPSYLRLSTVACYSPLTSETLPTLPSSGSRLRSALLQTAKRRTFILATSGVTIRLLL